MAWIYGGYGLARPVCCSVSVAFVSQELVYICGEVLNCTAAASKVFEYLDRTPLEQPAANLKPSNLEGRLTFRNVTFSYPTKPDAPALKVNLAR